MRILLDTHAALFMWSDPGRLSPAARELLEDLSNTLIFSQVSTWEICLKHRAGKLSLPAKPAAWLPKRIRESQLKYEPISDQALFRSAELPALHVDPFDRLLISTAQLLEVPLLSADRQMQAYPIKVVW